ncbi:hypothetical protein CUJ84_pRLN2000329 (plasmid) [Rhizobium leguminosarum]|uniref:Uncharacterized protein n=1 Tax=Rhizobium leguminosarum TaxID=384 RepID=A0A2K9ZF30_RHILE|nr:hypothetical protein CUJ84_pRLN2000329 [Rhizobium leguminosarum]
MASSLSSDRLASAAACSGVLTFTPLKDKYLVLIGTNYCRGIHPCAVYSHLLVRKMRHDLCLNLAHVFLVDFTYSQVKYRAYLNI